LGDGIRLEGVKAHMARLLTNALGNISRHTPSDAPVRVTLKEVKEGIELDLEDGGPGLSDRCVPQRNTEFSTFRQVSLS